tara:strand:- start:165 stop:1169 length:1005 start_codon:yes stop_codon:yes gene_type:complete
MISIGVIGYGYWGPNIVRNFDSNSSTKVHMVCDQDPGRLAQAKTLYPSIEVSSSSDELIKCKEIDAVVIATPVASHFTLALAALKAGKHVLIEKPIASTAEQAQKLLDEANKSGLLVMVDHTFLYTGAVRKMRELVNEKDFGDLRYYDSTRINLGLFQNDVNVLWDLAVHDLSIMSYILGRPPLQVSATGHSLSIGQPEYAAFMTVFFDDVIAHINVNWLSPVKVRRTLVGGSKKMIVYDDLEASEKIKLYDKGIAITETPEDVRKLLVSYRSGDMWSPNLEASEALAVEAAHFAACIEGKEKPIASGEQGLELVRILEAANKSMSSNGAPVKL